ncbi:MAG: hypothetical protein A3C04_04185 [Candidatus Wildermuthbacteria bacterium RIFCSPHIGHO2_02_FULL_45_25]|uniref:Uncharacterized protein n=1 Tax=Candidatus Wildermuthbacteria bacterium RIFCSPHIGHO2_02_FULL_45_25 TaxID=1802450 RepID=A0A1G2R1M8_9BACT|nr:MAG: hypothetical protein A3C04_04185 [Candidatus Wildermuthbacteria bacterium RIFCSPHIGHO2_02_FULL_45_25]
MLARINAGIRRLLVNFRIQDSLRKSEFQVIKQCEIRVVFDIKSIREEVVIVWIACHPKTAESKSYRECQQKQEQSVFRFARQG